MAAGTRRSIGHRALLLGATASWLSPLSAQTVDPTAPAGAASINIDALDAATKLSNAQKAASEAATAAWGAKKAEIEAQTAAEQAKFGTVTGQTGIKGLIQAGTTPPKAEAMLLVTRATLDTGRLIANRIKDKLDTRRDVLVLTNKADLSISDAVIFDLKAQQLKAAAEANGLMFSSCHAPRSAAEGEGGGRMAAVAAAGMVLDAAAKLGSYFMTDYSYGEVPVTLPPEMLSAAVVGNFTSWPNSFIIPSQSLVLGAQKLTDLLTPLEHDYLTAVGNRQIALGYADAHGDKDKAAAARCSAVAAAYDKSIAQYEGLFNSLTADPGGGVEPLGVRIVRQKDIQERLSHSPMVLLLTGTPAAAYYSKQNLWTFLGGIPLYTMGGAATTYTLFDPASGRVLATGGIAYHGGYRSVGAVERLINKANASEMRNGSR